MFDWHEDDILSFVVLETNGSNLTIMYDICPDEAHAVAQRLRQAADEIEAGGSLKH